MNRLIHFRKISNINFKRFYRSQSATHGILQKRETRDQFKELKIKNAEEVHRYFRKNGHYFATIDPLQLRTLADDAILSGMLEHATVEEIEKLKKMYCGNIAFEVDHIKSEEEKEWLYQAAEQDFKVTEKKQKRLCSLILKSQVFENFLAKRFPSFKRYSGEGAESMLVFFEEMMSEATRNGTEELMLSIPHRGRLSLLTGMLNFDIKSFFSKLKGHPEFDPSLNFIGDIPSHLTVSTDVEYESKNLHVTMIPNPSHLEASHPVIIGKARSRFLTRKQAYYNSNNTADSSNELNKILTIQVHGDAAIAGQGIVMETFALASLPHFEVGGSIHLILNNQIGFTTPQERASTAGHSSDIAKMISAPVVHVNGDSPEDVARVAKLAVDYRNKFNKDIVINMHCFRRWGHNELDDPTFTNPEMYDIIHQKQSVPDLYKAKLTEVGVFTEADLVQIEEEYFTFLDEQLKDADRLVDPVWTPFTSNWSGLGQASDKAVTVWDTGCDIDLLKFVGVRSTCIPEDFNIHQHLVKTFCEARTKKIESGENIDWALAEALAIGSLLLQGHHVRICGQDVGRGTFSHRHSMLVDQKYNELYVPLNNMSEEQTGKLEIANSPLIEESVLAFEYGVSIENPKHLAIWESQFGDFFNGAQIIIDTYIANGEGKWLLQSGLVMLLPHGMDGAGPDHSTSKIERFLQLSDSKEDSVDTDDVNMQIVNPTTSAQYFHLLRRQQIRNFRKPLIVASPKILLRMTAASSSLADMMPGSHFHPVLGDGKITENGKVDTVVFCSGKHFYDLEKQRTKQGKSNVSIIRLEELVPFPAEGLKQELTKYPNAQKFIWSQEEHRNQGAWSFISPRFQNLLNVKLSYHGRPVLCASSVGVSKWHVQEVEELTKTMFS